MIIHASQREALPEAFVMVDGCFDPLHRGHISYFRFAASLGLPVLCNLAGDAYIQSHKGRPTLLPEIDRAEVVNALGMIDYVFVSQQGTAWSLGHFRPRCYVKGAEWRGQLPEEQVKICAELDIEIVFAPPPLNSSTKILETFLEKRDAYPRIRKENPGPNARAS